MKILKVFHKQTPDGKRLVVSVTFKASDQNEERYLRQNLVNDYLRVPVLKVSPEEFTKFWDDSTLEFGDLNVVLRHPDGLTLDDVREHAYAVKVWDSIYTSYIEKTGVFVFHSEFEDRKIIRAAISEIEEIDESDPNPCWLLTQLLTTIGRF